jgi:hypothetical protein
MEGIIDMKTLKSSTIVEYNGVRISVKDLCAIFEMKLTTVLSRMNLLLWDDLKLALTTPVKPGNSGKTADKDALKVKWYGQLYKVSEIARACGINESTLRYHARRGIPVPMAAMAKGLRK